MAARLTRMRIECMADDPQQASLFLVELAGAMKKEQGGEWQEEDPGVHTIPASRNDQVWGRLTIRRVDEP